MTQGRSWLTTSAFQRRATRKAPMSRTRRRVVMTAGATATELSTNDEQEARQLEKLINEIRSRRTKTKEIKNQPAKNKEKTVGEEGSQRVERQQQQQQRQQQQRAAKNIIREKVPPINIFQQKTEETIKLDKLVLKNNFSVRRYSENKHSLICKTMEGYRKMKTILEKAQTQFYSFTAKADRRHSMLLKGVDPEADPEELLAELKSYESDNLKFLSIKNFTTPASRSNQRQLPIFLVQLGPESRIDNLKGIKYLNYHAITWEKINKKDSVLQCMRCQRFGHAASNCHMAYRCVKCEKDHKPGECPLGKEKVEDRSKLFCVLCRKNGHPASYRGCPKYEELKNKIKARKIEIEEQKRQKSRMFQNFVAPNMTFAQMASGQGNATRQQPQRPAPAPTPSGGDMELKAVLLSIQGQIAQLQKQLNEQATRIDIIYSSLFSEPTAP